VRPASASVSLVRERNSPSKEAGDDEDLSKLTHVRSPLVVEPMMKYTATRFKLCEDDGFRENGGQIAIDALRWATNVLVVRVEDKFRYENKDR
jgi:hypothetical protein